MGLQEVLASFGLGQDVHRHSAQNGQYTYWEASELGVPVLQYESDDTGLTLTTVVNDDDMRRQSVEAWSMARQSRSPDAPVEILEEIFEANQDPDSNLAKIFGYGHESVADMAEIGVQFEDVPFYVPLTLFNFGVQNSGQEKSTRYQPQFKETELDDLDNYLSVVPGRVREEYEGLRRRAQGLFQHHFDRFVDAFTDYFIPASDGDESSLEARAFDAARGSLLAGQRTGFGLKTKARRWGKMISLLKGRRSRRYVDVGESLEALLSPSEEVEESLGMRAHSPDLLKYTGAESRHREGFEYIREEWLSKHGFDDAVSVTDTPARMVLNDAGLFDSLSTEEKMAYHAVKRAHPGADEEDTAAFVKSLSGEAFAELGEVLFSSYDHHVSPSPDTAVTDTAVALTTSLGDVRDWNRHRPWTRFLGGLPDLYGPSPEPSTFKEVLSQGFVLPRYVTSGEAFASVRSSMREDYRRFYDDVHRFVDTVAEELPRDADTSFLMNALPFATAVNMVMYGNPRQGHYLTSLRHRPGGHINYRLEAWWMNQALADQHPIYEAMKLPEGAEPDPLSRSEFFDRS